MNFNKKKSKNKQAKTLKKIVSNETDSQRKQEKFPQKFLTYLTKQINTKDDLSNSC